MSWFEATHQVLDHATGWALRARDALRVPRGGPGSPSDSRFEGERLSWRLHEGVVEVELHGRPCNEIGSAALRELEALAGFVRRGAAGARALLLYSTVHRGFCAGADLRELHTELGGWRRRGVPRTALAMGVGVFLRRIHRVFDTLDQSPLLTVAAVHGFCFGGGFELALTADVLVADRTARFCFPELRLGLVPGFGGVPRLEREVPGATVRDLLLTGRSLSASRAHALGLVTQLVGRGKALGAARSIARQAVRFDPESTREAKRFCKPLPARRLREERLRFVRRMRAPVVEEALARFVRNDDVRPYLP